LGLVWRGALAGADGESSGLRMQVRRMTRLTNAFSKKWANHEAALALFFAYYNACRVHMTLKTTPAVKAGLVERPWSVLRLLDSVGRCKIERPGINPWPFLFDGCRMTRKKQWTLIGTAWSIFLVGCGSGWRQHAERGALESRHD
jgi:hypothetical protein